MIARLLALAALVAATPAGAAPTIRALFVGIDKYLYSRTNNPDADFKDLRGAVGDVGRMKDALRAAYGLDLDQPTTGCRSANTVSVTLTDGCATRANVLAALLERIDASRAGDTLIFYYAGHGSQLVDDQRFDQASGMSDTILPADARQPGAPANADILDRELRGYIDRATAKGVNVITIFDSCNSGTGTRGQRTGPKPPGESRHVPRLEVHALQRPVLPAIAGPGGGYRVHLAAAADWQSAREAPAAAGGDDRRGLFTTALTEVMRQTPRATFGDMIRAVTARVSTAALDKQTPQVEGAVNATMGGPDRPVPLYTVARGEQGRPTLTAGRLSGITAGSTFALFAGSTAALTDGAKPLATATAGTPDNWGAPLRFTGAPPVLPPGAVARELTHAWGDGTLRVRLGVVVDGLAAVTAVLARLPMVREDAHAPFTIGVFHPGGPLTISDERGVIAELGPADAGFEARLTAALQKIARAETLLALAGDGNGSSLCVAAGDYDVFACPPLTAGPVRTLPANVAVKLTVANTGAAERYLYVLLIGPSYGITLVVPRDRGIDGKVAPDLPQQRSFRFVHPGRYRFVTITSDRPLAASALEQTGVGARGGEAAASGWTAAVTEVMVTAGDR